GSKLFWRRPMGASSLWCARHGHRLGGESPLVSWSRRTKRTAERRTARAEGSGERSCGPTNRNRIRGGAEQGERARNREALGTKARRRRSGGRAAKADVLTRGDLAS